MICSTFSLTWADEAFWGIEDDQAGYVHRLVVAAERRGGGLRSAPSGLGSEEPAARAGTFYGSTV